jgi:hypothetical protein
MKTNDEPDAVKGRDESDSLIRGYLRHELAKLVHDRTGIDPEKCFELGEVILAAGWVLGPHVHTEDCADGIGADAILTCAQAPVVPAPLPQEQQPLDELLAGDPEDDGLRTYIEKYISQRDRAYAERDAAQATAERLAKALRSLVHDYEAWGMGRGDSEGHQESAEKLARAYAALEATAQAVKAGPSRDAAHPAAPEGIDAAEEIRNVIERAKEVLAFNGYEPGCVIQADLDGALINLADLVGRAPAPPPTPEGITDAMVEAFIREDQRQAHLDNYDLTWRDRLPSAIAAALAASDSAGQPRGLRPLAPEGITDALVIRLTEDPALLEAFDCYEGSACGIDEVQGVVRAVLTAAARSAPPTPEGDSL